jgi:hypothetical protein
MATTASHAVERAVASCCATACEQGQRQGTAATGWNGIPEEAMTTIQLHSAWSISQKTRRVGVASSTNAFAQLISPLAIASKCIPIRQARKKRNRRRSGTVVVDGIDAENPNPVLFKPRLFSIGSTNHGEEYSSSTRWKPLDNNRPFDSARIDAEQSQNMMKDLLMMRDSEQRFFIRTRTTPKLKRAVVLPLMSDGSGPKRGLEC